MPDSISNRNAKTVNEAFKTYEARLQEQEKRIEDLEQILARQALLISELEMRIAVAAVTGRGSGPTS